ncbi:hypothetical protein K1718_06345 [Roseibium porphyridii]|uniref:Uncharacterized protein n=1 Tax=Roseibium porphyridii TaxID=2866279 RepID=A0ABY8F6V9_9HYPH|nr:MULTISPECIES: hypothetical protein [Stappiaceae]QFT30318.1 hypothetical protein FIV00_07530 [Labrenzia sp. THAF82]WFE90966.1 hypothetical protein K1718_06345 [Roseibium sp. KMA01]
MKAMLLAFVATAVIAVGASLTLDRMGYSSAQQATGSSVRLGN